jgi:hypothetical protein
MSYHGAFLRVPNWSHHLARRCSYLNTSRTLSWACLTELQASFPILKVPQTVCYAARQGRGTGDNGWSLDFGLPIIYSPQFIIHWDSQSGPLRSQETSFVPRFKETWPQNRTELLHPGKIARAGGGRDSSHARRDLAEYTGRFYLGAPQSRVQVDKRARALDRICFRFLEAAEASANGGTVCNERRAPGRIRVAGQRKPRPRKLDP